MIRDSWCSRPCLGRGRLSTLPAWLTSGNRIDCATKKEDPVLSHCPVTKEGPLQSDGHTKKEEQRRQASSLMKKQQDGNVTTQRQPVKKEEELTFETKDAIKEDETTKTSGTYH